MLWQVLRDWNNWCRRIDSSCWIGGSGVCVRVGGCVGGTIHTWIMSLICNFTMSLWFDGSMCHILLLITNYFFLWIETLSRFLLDLTLLFLSLWMFSSSFGLIGLFRLRIFHRFNLSETIFFGDDLFTIIHGLFALW